MTDPLTRPSFTCPTCGLTSYHPEDVRNQYCGHCHTYADATSPLNWAQYGKLCAFELVAVLTAPDKGAARSHFVAARNYLLSATAAANGRPEAMKRVAEMGEIVANTGEFFGLDDG